MVRIVLRRDFSFACFVRVWGLTLLLCGCATTPYTYGVTYPAYEEKCGPEAIEVSQGGRHPVLDAAGWIFGLPERIVLWNWRAGNHQVSDETQVAVTEYLAQNDLGDVKVRVNHYDPIGEWRRLAENKRMAAGYRYTVGTLSVVSYTLIPGRLFGGDYYNPYTNTINLYSDVPAIAIQEAAYAKDIHNRPRPGTYAIVNELPLVGMWHETINTNDALGYFAVEGSNEEQREAWHVLGPRYGTHAAGGLRMLLRPAEGAFVLTAGPLSLGGALVGHAFGRIEAPPETDSEPGDMPEAKGVAGSDDSPSTSQERPESATASETRETAPVTR